MTTTDNTDHGEVDKAGVELHIDLPVDLRLALLLVVLPDSGHAHCDSVIEGDGPLNSLWSCKRATGGLARPHSVACHGGQVRAEDRGCVV